jgi:hypothetical protein
LGALYKEMFEIFDPDVFHFGGDEVSTFYSAINLSLTKIITKIHKYAGF